MGFIRNEAIALQLSRSVSRSRYIATYRYSLVVLAYLRNEPTLSLLSTQTFCAGLPQRAEADATIHLLFQGSDSLAVELVCVSKSLHSTSKMTSGSVATGQALETRHHEAEASL
jgi:hypothetical protein